MSFGCNSISCNITEYYQNQSTFDLVITKINSMNFFETQWVTLSLLKTKTGLKPKLSRNVN